MLKDIFNRELKIGDMVLYVRNKMESPLNYGLVLSEKSVFDGKRKYHCAEECILVTNFDELENKKYQELVEAYNLFELERQKKKIRNIEQKEHIKYGLYRNGNKYFIYLGKMAYSDEFALREKGNNKYYYYGNKEGYAYFIFVDNYSLNRILKDVLKSREFNIINALHHKDSIGRISTRLGPSIGYTYIDLSKKVIPYDEYLGQVNIKGVTNKGYIYLYDELVKLYGEGFEIDRNDEDYYELLKDCYLLEK